MSIYRRETDIDAPLDAVWAFHSAADGLEALTPDFMHLEVEEVTIPNGDGSSDELVEGSRLELSVQPFGIGPRQRMMSVITERSRADGMAMFCDTMESGPFAEWEHTHEFFGFGDGTHLVDTVEYQLPGGSVGRVISPLGRLGLAPMFRDRHRRTKERLEQTE